MIRDADLTIAPLTTEQIVTLDPVQMNLPLGGSMDSDVLVTGSEPAWTFSLSDGNIDTHIDWNNMNNIIGNGGIGSSGLVWSDTLAVQPSAKIALNGDDADIEINGESVVGMLREIRDRLNIIQVSETMEAEWDELRALREQYEAKLAECREKSQAWEALKQMPPPRVP